MRFFFKRLKNMKVWKIVFASSIALFAIITFVIEPLMLREFNKIGAKKLPAFTAKAEGLDLSFFRGRIVLDNLVVRLKESKRIVNNTKTSMIDIAWKELFKGQLAFDIGADNSTVYVSNALLNTLKKLSDQTKPKKKALPFTITSGKISNSKILFGDIIGVKAEGSFPIEQIEASVGNISKKEGSPLSPFNLSAKLGKTGKFTSKGFFDASQIKPSWEMDTIIKNYNLRDLNPELQAQLPSNIDKGSLDLYAETMSRRGKISGYVKPFIRDLKMMGNKNEFKGTKHFFIELLAAIADFATKNSNKKTVATRVPFIYENGKFHADTGEAITKVIQHGLTETKEVKPGIENKYSLSKTKPKEVQAQEEDLKKDKK